MLPIRRKAVALVVITFLFLVERQIEPHDYSSCYCCSISSKKKKKRKARMISRQFYDKPYYKIPGVLEVYGHCQEINSGSKTFNMELSLKIGGICVAFLNMQPPLKEKRSRINNLFCDFLFKTKKVLDEVKTEKKNVAYLSFCLP